MGIGAQPCCCPGRQASGSGILLPGGSGASGSPGHPTCCIERSQAVGGGGLLAAFEDGESVCQLQVTWAGIINGLCSQCTTLNGTWPLDCDISAPTIQCYDYVGGMVDDYSPCCHWGYQLPARKCQQAEDPPPLEGDPCTCEGFSRVSACLYCGPRDATESYFKLVTDIRGHLGSSTPGMYDGTCYMRIKHTFDIHKTAPPAPANPLLMAADLALSYTGPASFEIGSVSNCNLCGASESYSITVAPVKCTAL